jgi:hypothetical protein
MNRGTAWLHRLCFFKFIEQNENNYEAQTLFFADWSLVACQHKTDPKHTINTPCQKGTESGTFKNNEANNDDNIGVKYEALASIETLPYRIPKFQEA